MPSSTAFLYVECDIPADKTLTEWRRERHAAATAAAPQRRSLRLVRMLRVRWSA